LHFTIRKEHLRAFGPGLDVYSRMIAAPHFQRVVSSLCSKLPIVPHGRFIYLVVGNLTVFARPLDAALETCYGDAAAFVTTDPDNCQPVLLTN